MRRRLSEKFTKWNRTCSRLCNSKAPSVPLPLHTSRMMLKGQSREKTCSKADQFLFFIWGTESTLWLHETGLHDSCTEEGMDLVITLFATGQGFVRWFTVRGNEPIIATVSPICEAHLLTKKLLGAILLPQGAISPRTIVWTREPHNAAQCITTHLHFVHIPCILWLKIFWD